MYSYYTLCMYVCKYIFFLCTEAHDTGMRLTIMHVLLSKSFFLFLFFLLSSMSMMVPSSDMPESIYICILAHLSSHFQCIYPPTASLLIQNTSITETGSSRKESFVVSLSTPLHRLSCGPRDVTVGQIFMQQRNADSNLYLV